MVPRMNEYAPIIVSCVLSYYTEERDPVFYEVLEQF